MLQRHVGRQSCANQAIVSVTKPAGLMSFLARSQTSIFTSSIRINLMILFAVGKLGRLLGKLGLKPASSLCG